MVAFCEAEIFPTCSACEAPDKASLACVRSLSGYVPLGPAKLDVGSCLRWIVDSLAMGRSELKLSHPTDRSVDDALDALGMEGGFYRLGMPEAHPARSVIKLLHHLGSDTHFRGPRRVKEMLLFKRLVGH